jgi:hypothetical protein
MRAFQAPLPSRDLVLSNSSLRAIFTFGHMFIACSMVERSRLPCLTMNWLRNEHSGGDFHIIIRRGKRMELSGIICIGVPLARQAYR